MSLIPVKIARFYRLVSILYGPCLVTFIGLVMVGAGCMLGAGCAPSVDKKTIAETTEIVDPSQKPQSRKALTQSDSSQFAMVTMAQIQSVAHKFNFATSGESESSCFDIGDFKLIPNPTGGNDKVFQSQVDRKGCPTRMERVKGTFTGSEVFEVYVSSSEDLGSSRSVTGSRGREQITLPFRLSDVEKIRVRTENMVFRAEGLSGVRFEVNWSMEVNRSRSGGYEFSYRYQPEKWEEVISPEQKTLGHFHLGLTGRFGFSNTRLILLNLESYLTLEREEKRGADFRQSTFNDYSLKNKGTISFSNCGQPLGKWNLTKTNEDGSSEAGELDSKSEKLFSSLDSTEIRWACENRELVNPKPRLERKQPKERVLQ